VRSVAEPRSNAWMSHTRWDYASLMHQRGFRVTPQRQLILDAICDGHGHTTLEEVFERVRLSPETFRFRAFTRLLQLEHLVQSQQVDGDLFWR